MSAGSVYELESALRTLGRDLSYPETPDLRGAVMARIESAPDPVPIGSRSRFRIALVAAAVVAIASVATVGLSPSARRAVADFLGVEGIRIEFDDSAPVEPRPSDRQLGERMTLAEAQTIVDFDIQVPAELGEPDEVWVLDEREVNLVWHPSSGLPESAHTGYGAVLTQFEGSPALEHIKKIGVTGTDVTYLQIDNGDAFFIEGAPHVLVHLPTGGTTELAPRLAGNTLLWESGLITFRLEAETGIDRALEIANSLD